MAESRGQGRSRAGDHLVLYDGVCGFCSHLVQFLLEHVRGGVFDFAPLQGPTARSLITKWGGNPDELTTFYVCADYRSPDAARVFSRGDAALFIARQIGWPWKLLVAARAVPKARRDAVYNGVARRRYRLFGRYDQCMVPPPDVRHRFVE